MPDKKPVARKAKAPVQTPFLCADTKKFGTQLQQLELNDFLQALTPEQLQTIQSLLARMKTGACIYGDGTIDQDTGLKTTGGYRKSVHYMVAYFQNRPTQVKLT
jgi:hypothetical protein